MLIDKSILAIMSSVVLGLWASNQEIPNWKIDFAEYEHAHPLTQEEVHSLLPENEIDVGQKFRTAQWNQDAFDLLYAKLNAPQKLPEGFHKGAVIMPKDQTSDTLVSVLSQMGVVADRPTLEKVMMRIWGGKHFLPNRLEPVLKNRILGILMFPAFLFYGESLLDGRKDSLIIDYAFADDLKDDKEAQYNDELDWLATRLGMGIRDEIRALQEPDPVGGKRGFYLGRAYMKGFFALNFVLYQSSK